MSKFIDANDLLNRALADEIEFRDVDGIYETGVTIKDLTKIVNEMSESIVRCEACRFYDNKRTTSLNGYCELCRCYKEANGFCNCGERRENENA